MVLGSYFSNVLLKRATPISIPHLSSRTPPSGCGSSDTHHPMLKTSSFQILVSATDFTPSSLSLRTRLLPASREACAAMKFGALATTGFNGTRQITRTMHPRTISSSTMSATVASRDWTARKDCWLIVAVLRTVLFSISLIQKRN